uniref:Reverse transcriptase-like protein n=1 Tax=Chlamydomonas reinhardtii TaxID=3055 RepID=B2XYD4_CHLRE|nr:reverse transcriptase-like protein [Chlamydomonas reinhardtii]
MFTVNYILDLFHTINATEVQHTLMLALMHKRPASLHEVLRLAGLLQGYKDFLSLTKQAEAFFQAGDYRSAFNTISKMWVHPQIVPALLLMECFETRELTVPYWYKSIKLRRQYIQKKNGGVRPIIVAHKGLRICMAVINRLLQSCCVSWSNQTFGFRPGFGTHHAVLHLAQKAQQMLNKQQQAVLVTFDLQAAYNSVDIKHLMQTLQLQYLPNDMKKLIWMWQHLPLAQLNAGINGLAQGYAYSPTLFAWYVDQLVGQHMDFTIYADNFAGVFLTQQDAQFAVKEAQTLLQKSGLLIAPSSIKMHLLDKNQHSELNWLGHKVLFPSCTVKLQHHQLLVNQHSPQVWTIQKWDKMLRTLGWVQLALNADWRRF